MLCKRCLNILTIKNLNIFCVLLATVVFMIQCYYHKLKKFAIWRLIYAWQRHHSTMKKTALNSINSLCMKIAPLTVIKFANTQLLASLLCLCHLINQIISIIYRILYVMYTKVIHNVVGFCAKEERFRQQRNSSPHCLPPPPPQISICIKAMWWVLRANGWLILLLIIKWIWKIAINTKILKQTSKTLLIEFLIYTNDTDARWHKKWKK